MSLIPPQNPSSGVQPVAPPNTAGVAPNPNVAGNTPGANLEAGTLQAGVTPSTSSSNLVAASNAAPHLTSAAIVGAATSASGANDAAVRAQVVNAYNEAKTMSDSLNASGVDFQHTFWQSASPALKSLLAATGYKPPQLADVAPNNQGGGGFWHGLIHQVDNVRHAGAWALDKSVVQNLKDVGNVFSTVGAPVMQLSRDVMATGQSALMGEGGQLAQSSNEIMSPQQQSVGQRIGDFFQAVDPSNLIRNWHAVANGAETFQPAVVQYVQKEMGITGKTLDLAKVVASGAGLQAALASVAPNQRASAYALIQTTPKFMDAVQMLSDGHASLGQTLFGGLSAQQMHQVAPFTKIGAIQGTTAALDTSGMAAGAAAMLSGGAGALIGNAAGDAAVGGTLAGESAGALETMGTLKGAAATATALLGPTGAALGIINKSSPDTALTISPFGIKIHPLSGVVDGLMSWYSNPAFVGLQARGAYNSVVHSLSILDAQGNAVDVAAKYLNQAPERAWAQKFVNAVTTPWLPEHGDFAPSANVSQLARMGISDNAEWVAIVQKEYPKLLDAAKATAAGDADAMPRAVGTMLGDQQAIINIMRGRLGAAMHGDQQLPHLTIPQRVIDTIKGIGESTFQGRRFNPDAMSYRELSVDAFGKPITEDGMAIAEATDQKLGHAARFLRRGTTLIPENTVVKFSDPQRIKYFRQVAGYALPTNKIDELVNAYAAIAPSDIGLQNKAWDGLYQEVMNAGEVGRTPEGKAWMDGLQSGRDFSLGDGEMYADPRNPGGPMQMKAIFPTELADARALPSYQQFYKFAKKAWFMNQLDMRLNSDLFDKYMSRYWKIPLLLRSGFALRFAGEEVLSQILRNGMASYFKGAVARSLYDTANPTKEALRAAQEAVAAQTQRALDAAGGDINAINELDTARMYQAVASHIPDEVLKAIPNPEEFKASIQGWEGINWLRRAGVKFIGEDILKGAYNLARRGVLDSAFEDTIDAIRSHGSIYFGDIPKTGDEAALIRHEDGSALEFRPTGKFHYFTKENAVPAWSYRLGGIKDTEVGQGIARAYKFGGVDAQQQYAEDWINGTKYQTKIDEATAEFNAQAVKWQAAGSPEEGKVWESLDGLQAKLDAAEAAMENHQKLINKFEVNFQTRAGETMDAGTATREEIVRDWAQSMVRKVNRLTTTREGQDFNEAGDRIPINPDEPQLIRLRSGVSPKVGYQIGTRDVGRGMTQVEDGELAYHGVPEGHVRLFRSSNTFDTHEPPARPGQGRAWTPSYQEAVNRAGANGEIYKIDVPKGSVAEHYNLHAPEGTDLKAYLNEISDAQHAGAKGSGAAPKNVRGYFESGDIKYANVEGPQHRYLMDEIGRGNVPSNDELNMIDPVHRPDNLSVPEQMLKATPGTIEKFLTKGMRQMVGRPANWLSRQPIFTYNYTNALDETTKMLAARGIADDSGDLAHDIAMERAFNETIPYIHNPASKSQMSVIVRNLAPFWFAQEQFYKRWARLFGAYPEAWYKLQMTMNGLRSVGFVYTDQYGKDAFVYPGSQVVLSFLAKYPFMGSIPVGVGISGEISQLNPTLTTGGMPIPSLGPIVTIPLDLAGVAMAHFGVPFISQLAQKAAGPEAPQFNQEGNWAQDTLEQLTPSVVNRFVTWSQNQVEGKPMNVTDPIFMSLMIMGAQQLEVSGHGLTAADLANPKLGSKSVQEQQYMDRIANWAKSLLFMRTLFGFFGPTVPTFKISDGGLGAQLTALINEMPYNDAITAFIKAHPNATADTIFASTVSDVSGSGTYVPATQQALDYMTQNASFFKDYSQIAPWSFPAKASQGLFNSNAYEQEIAMDLRTRRPLFSADLVGSWYGEVKYAEGANVYYPMEQLFQAAGSSTQTDATTAQATLGITAEQAMAQLKLPAGTDVKQIWSSWETNFKASHPLFAEQQTASSAVSTARRGNIINELQTAITNEALPKTEWSKRIEQLMGAYDIVQAAYPAVKGTVQATENKQAFLTWATAFVQDYPEVAPFYQGVLSKAVAG